MPSLPVIRNHSTTRRPRPIKRLRLVLLTSLLLAALGAGLVALGRGLLPAPSGPYAVGRTTYRWVDDSRPETMTDASDDHRDVVAHVWYPAQAGGRGAGYLPDYAALRPALMSIPEFGWLKTLGLGLLSSYAWADAPVSGAQDAYPLLVFMPGNRTNAGLYSALLEDLASHGYVVAAIDHLYDAGVVLLSDGRAALFDESRWPPPPAAGSAGGSESEHARFYRERVDVRAADAAFVLQRLADLQPGGGDRLAGRVDLARAGVLGHSVGGVAAARACQVEPRFQACLNLDGLAPGGLAFYSDAGSIEQPFMLLIKATEPATDAMLDARGLTRAEWEAGTAQAAARQADLLSSVAGGSYRVTVPGAQHVSFTDGPLLLGGRFTSGGLASRHMEIIRWYARAFFDHHLASDESACLLTALAELPEAVFESFCSGPGDAL